jgi:DNA-binding transcriptional MerR regulator
MSSAGLFTDDGGVPLAQRPTVQSTVQSVAIEQPRDNSKAPSAFRTISEVATDLAVPQHVLRFWESKFPQIRPLKRGGGRRYYRPEDITLLRQIQNLLYNQGYTIRGVQKVLREYRPIHRISQTPSLAEVAAAAAGEEVAEQQGMEAMQPALQAPPRERLPLEVRREVEALRDELKSLRAMLKAAGI